MWTSISYYDLLTRIKENKQPKKIRYTNPYDRDYEFEWDKGLCSYSSFHTAGSLASLMFEFYEMYEDTFFNSDIGIEIYEDPLTEMEREWLANYVKPFRNKIEMIEKRERGDDEVKAVWLMVYCKGEDNGSTPLLPDNMFKGLEANTGYTLEDLEL